VSDGDDIICVGEMKRISPVPKASTTMPKGLPQMGENVPIGHSPETLPEEVCAGLTALKSLCHDGVESLHNGELVQIDDGSGGLTSIMVD
jgi:hypothetical protein